MPDDLSDITETDAAVLYALALHAVGKLTDYEADNGPRRDGAAIPRAVMTYGEAEALLPGLLVMIVHAFPALRDEEYVEALVRGATGSRPN